MFVRELFETTENRLNDEPDNGCITTHQGKACIQREEVGLYVKYFWILAVGPAIEPVVGVLLSIDVRGKRLPTGRKE